VSNEIAVYPHGKQNQTKHASTIQRDAQAGNIERLEGGQCQNAEQHKE